MATDESTPLRLSEPDRSYMYMTARNRSYRSKVRQFQCCICAGLLGAFVIAMVISVAYMVDHDVEDETDDNGTTPIQQQSDLQSLLTATWPRQDASRMYAPHVLWATEEDTQSSVAAGQEELSELDQLEIDHPPSPLPASHPSSLHRKAMLSSPEAGEAARVGKILVAATKDFAKKGGGHWGGKWGPRLPPSDWMPGKWCPELDTEGDKCTPSPYRTVDGTCNNLQNPDFGVAMRPFRRGLPAAYSDGIAAPRLAKDGSPLPNARKVSQTVHRPLYRNDPKFSVMLAVWGQFTDHDFTATATSQRKDGSAITCCNTVWQHPECFPVKIEDQDPFYAQYNVTCIDFVRSAAAPTCSLGPREQLNQVTPFIDGSVVYGSNEQIGKDLRAFYGGLLLSSLSQDGRELLPVDTSAAQDGCNQAQEAVKGRYCFKSGDARANENLHLTTLHLIMARQHNRVAKQLSQMNPEWNDEKLYQESRRIIGAQMQHVTYNEFLPIILGQDLTERLELRPQASGYYYGYNSSIDVQIANEFAASAFRFGHTLLQGLLKVIANDTSSPDYVQMHKMLFNPFGLYDKGYMSSTVKGALRTDIQKADTYFSSEISQKLFQRPNGPCGLDLVSLNVQRGRDHGLPGYTAWREYCGLPKPESFSELEAIIDSDTVNRLQLMYKSVDDIDMYTGIVSENPMEFSGILGPTATCIIADQFVRFKRGDRYWYETPEAPQAFTPVQLDELRKTSLSTLLCDNTDSLEEVQPWAMKSIGPDNEITKCSDIPRPDLSAWSEYPQVSLSASSKGVKPRKMPSHKVPKGDKVKKSSHLIIKARVTSGNITGSYGAGPLLTLWDGNFPAAIPFPYLDYPYENKSFDPIQPPKSVQYRGGILWGGRVDITSPKSIYISANYHVPITPLVVRDRSIKEWWCGEGELELEVEWNSTEMFDVPLSNYFTPILFGQEGDEIMDKAFDDVLPTILQARVDRDPLEPTTLPRLPLIIIGKYSDDFSKFWWSGEVYLILTRPPPEPEVQVTASGPTSEISASGTIISGTITLANDTTIWDGQLPLDIPISGTISKTGLMQISTALLYLKVSMTTAQEVNVIGNISIPQSSATEALSWNSGRLNLTADVDAAIPLINYVRSYMCLCYVFIKDNTKVLMASANNEIVKPKAKSPLNQVLVVLEGDSINSSTFRWSGKIKITVLPPYQNEESLPLLQAIRRPLTEPINLRDVGRLALGGKVSSGKVSAYNGKMPKNVLFYGAFPVEIPLPLFDRFLSEAQSNPALTQTENVFHGHGIVWNGKIAVRPGTKQLEAYMDFRFPLFEHGINTFYQDWTLGQVEFLIDVAWNSSTLENVNYSTPPGVEYFSRIELHCDGNSPDQTKNSSDVAYTIFRNDNDNVTISPIILHGIRDNYKSVFLWSGAITIIFH